MPDFSPTPIPDRDDLLAFIRTELSTFQQFAFDALKRPLDDPELMGPWDALEQILDGAENALDVIKTSTKDMT